jgi:hypothetical protein
MPYPGYPPDHRALRVALEIPDAYRAVTAFIGWFVYDFESHARTRFNGATGQIAVRFSLSSKPPAILQLCEN